MCLASREWTERAAMLWEDQGDPAGDLWNFTDPDSDWTMYGWGPEESEDVTSHMSEELDESTESKDLGS